MVYSLDLQEKWLIAGLGNPGFKHRRTRHNLGYMVINRLAQRFKARFSPADFFNLAEVHKPEFVLYLMKPMTYMNRSGLAISSFLQHHHLPFEHILIVLDDLALPIGKIRLRPGGSDGGHNGLASVINNVKSSKVPRLRIGTGLSNTEDVSGFVLSPFKLREKKIIKTAVQNACDAVEMIINQGLETAMNSYNQ